jgi:hypothetical protein
MSKATIDPHFHLQRSCPLMLEMEQTILQKKTFHELFYFNQILIFGCLQNIFLDGVVLWSDLLFKIKFKAISR